MIVSSCCNECQLFSACVGRQSNWQVQGLSDLMLTWRFCYAQSDSCCFLFAIRYVPPQSVILGWSATILVHCKASIVSRLIGWWSTRRTNGEEWGCVVMGMWGGELTTCQRERYETDSWSRMLEEVQFSGWIMSMVVYSFLNVKLFPLGPVSVIYVRAMCGIRHFPRDPHEHMIELLSSYSEAVIADVESSLQRCHGSEDASCCGFDATQYNTVIIQLPHFATREQFCWTHHCTSVRLVVQYSLFWKCW